MNKKLGYYFKKGWVEGKFVFARLSFVQKLSLLMYLIVSAIGKILILTRPFFAIADENINNQSPEEAKKEEEAIKAPEHYEKMVMEEGKSYFDGKASEKFGWTILGFFITILTAFLGFPWAMCMKYRYETKHTVINGRRLCFDGKGSQLFGRFLLWLVLSILTLGIYGVNLSSRVKKWKITHTHFLTKNGEVI